MNSKIKEFKGELNSVFGAETVLAENAHKVEEGVTKSLLPINSIKSREEQPRKTFNELALENLAKSITQNGIIQPILVSHMVGGFYEIIVGERRWRAAKMAGLSEIPAIIREYDEPRKMAVALIENIQREDLNPLEEALAIQHLLEASHLTQAKVAENIGRSRSSVANLLRLLNLEEDVKNLMTDELLEMGHARALLSLSGETQIMAAQRVVACSLSVRQTEQLVNRMLNPVVRETYSLDVDRQHKVDRWKEKASKQLATNVQVHFSAQGKGRVVIPFDSTEEADWLFNQIIKD